MGMRQTHDQTRLATLGAAVTLGILTGCASPSANMRVGSEVMALNLQDQRAAMTTVTVSPEVPAGAKLLADVDASRCHRFQGDIEPTDEMVLSDLKIAAYAKGADGIARVSIVRELGLTRNCWYILTGRAATYRAAAANR